MKTYNQMIFLALVVNTQYRLLKLLSSSGYPSSQSPKSISPNIQIEISNIDLPSVLLTTMSE